MAAEDEELRRSFPNIYGRPASSRPPVVVPASTSSRRQVLPAIARVASRMRSQSTIHRVFQAGGGNGQLRITNQQSNLHTCAGTSTPSRQPQPHSPPCTETSTTHQSGFTPYTGTHAPCRPDSPPHSRTHAPRRPDSPPHSETHAPRRPDSPPHSGTHAPRRPDSPPHSGTHAPRRPDSPPHSRTHAPLYGTSRAFQSGGGNGQMRLVSRQTDSSCCAGTGTSATYRPNSPNAGTCWPGISATQSRLPSQFPQHFNPRRSYKAPKWPKHSRASPTNTLGRKFTKTIVCVGSDEDVLPRSRRREELNSLGAVVHLVDMWSNWTESEARNAIETAFHGFIDMSKPEPRFNFMKALNGKLCLPNVGPSHQWSGEKIRQISGQGDLYIRATYSLNLQYPDVNMEYDHDAAKKVSVEDGNEPSPSYQAQLAEMREVVSETAFSDSVLLDALQQYHGDVNMALDMLISEDDTKLWCGSNSPYTSLVEHERDSASEQGQSDNDLPHVSASLVDPLHADLDLSVTEILKRRSMAIIVHNPVCELEITREKIWRQACGFYKNSQIIPGDSRLCRQLVVEFKGEEGIDAGALKYDFFESLLGEANQRLFEGPLHCRLPKKDWGLDSSFTLVGLMIAHSLIQGGPGFPILCPAIYDFMVSLDQEKAAQNVKSVTVIPKNAATASLLEFIEKIDKAATQEEIDELLDNDTNMATINASGWSPTHAISITSKSILVQGLLIDEVLGKRERCIQALRKGLDNFGILDLIIKYPQMKCLFVCEGKQLTAEDIQSMIQSSPPDDPSQTQAYEYFIAYLQARASVPQEVIDDTVVKEEASLSDLLKFTTGLSSVTPMQNQKLTLQYLAEDCKLPTANACFCMLNIPTCYHNQDDFFKAFDKAVLYSKDYFGQE